MAEPTAPDQKPIPVACFAPPLTDGLLAEYEAIATVLPPDRGDVRDAMRECLAGVKLWWNLPESTGSPDDAKQKIVHHGKLVRIPVVSLTPDLVERLWDAVPWSYELNAIQALFSRAFYGIEQSPSGAVVVHEPWIHDVAVRDACFHLLWYARELCLDREPLSQDKLPG